MLRRQPAALEQREIDAYIAPGRAKHASAGEGGGARVAAMREKIKAGGHASPYRLRKQLPEPVFGQIKQARGFRQFLLRGVEKVAAEWGLVCLAHNILKLAQGRIPLPPWQRDKQRNKKENEGWRKEEMRGKRRLGLIEAGTRASLRGAAFVLLALPLGALLVCRETRARHPVVPPRLFRDWRFAAANAMMVVMYASLTGSLFLLPFLLIYTYGYSAAAAGAAFLPFSAIMAVGSRTAGGLALRIGSRAAWRPRRCRRVREHVGVSPRVGCGCRGVPARDVDGGGARRGRRVNGNCVLGDDPSEHRGRI